jgi:predicted porin
VYYLFLLWPVWPTHPRLRDQSKNRLLKQSHHRQPPWHSPIKVGNGPDFADVDLGGAATVDSVARLKLRAGYDLGRTLVYATAGMARVDTTIGADNGEFAGLGVAYQFNERITVGGEVLTHSFDDIGGSGVDADATSISIRSSFRF